MARKVKEQQERVTPENLDKVIELLNPKEGKPATKKYCCELLGIAYNTTRLDNLIEKHIERKVYAAERRAKNKGKPATDEEIKFAVQEYIEGSSIENIAQSLYRGSSFVKSILEANHVTMRPTSYNYFSPAVVPDESARDRFNIGEIVFCSRYNVNAIVKSEQLTKEHGYVYKLWLLGDQQQFAFVAAYDLASLDHIKQLGVAING